MPFRCAAACWVGSPAVNVLLGDRLGGRQVVVIAAGGYGRSPIPGNLGDSLVAYALPVD